MVSRSPLPFEIRKMNQDQIETMKHVGDAASAVIVVGALASWLPPVAALLTIVWTAIRIFETKTVQRLFGREA